MRELWILTEREFRVRLAKRGYWIFTVIGLLLLVGLTFLPSIMNLINSKSTPTVLLTDKHDIVASRVEHIVNGNQKAYDFKLSIDNSVKPSTMSNTEIQNMMKTTHSQLAVEVMGDSANTASLVVRENGSVDPTLLTSVENLMKQSIMTQRVAAMPPSTRAVLSAPVSVSVHQLQSGSLSQEQLWASRLLVYYMLTLLFATIAIYGSWVAQGVVEEKSNRIVEMMLVTTRPWQILFGKIIGIGIVGLLQYVIWLLAAAVALAARKQLSSLPVQNVPAETLILFPVFFIVGYILYATMYGIAGSLVTRVEEQQMAITPVVLIMVILFYVSMFGVLPSPNSSFAVVVSFIPIITPMAMFTRAALSAASVPVWQIVLSILVTLLFNGALVAYGARVYKRFALRTSGKSSWKLLMSAESAGNGATEGPRRKRGRK